MKQEKTDIDLYERNAALRAFVQAFPGGGSIDAFLSAKINEMERKRMHEFFAALGDGRVQLSPELLESEEFLHRYFMTVKAVQRTARIEKVKVFASLLQAAMLPNAFTSSDEFEEYIQIIDELSPRELLVLVILEKYEEEFWTKHIQEAKVTASDKPPNAVQMTGTFWEPFLDEASKTLKITREEVTPILTRVSRTGLYEPISGAFFDYGGGRGTLTVRFKKIKEIIRQINSRCEHSER